MKTKTELSVQLWTSRVSRVAIGKRQAEVEMHLKYKKLSAELELAIKKLEMEIKNEKSELRRDKKLHAITKKPTVVAATKDAPTTTTPPDEKTLITQKHDLKMKARKIKDLEDTLPRKIDALKLQFEYDYNREKVYAEEYTEVKRQHDDILEYYKERVEHGYSDEE